MSTSPTGNVAFVFPGQGSQAVGMGLDLYQNSPAARAVFEEVDQALGEPVSRIFFEGPEEELTKTVNTQPGILTVSIACLKAMEEALGVDRMPSPALVAGHSLGEYTALVAAGAMTIAEGARLVRERGRLMQYASELQDGTMAAILSLDQAVLEEICRETDTEISNINVADQIVISGTRAGVEKAMELASERGARRTVALPVGGAFHSRLMQPAQEGLTKAVEELQLQAPTVPVVANCTGKPITTVDEVKQELLTGLCSPVRWLEIVQHMSGAGVSSFYEIGPGRALAGMVRRINPEAEVANVSDVETLGALTA